MIPVVDLFAGPGGLGEGFSSFKKNKIFNIVLSVEKEKFACDTLLLRSFFHQFKKKPLDYYEYLRGRTSRDDLYNKYPVEYKAASSSILNLELGVRNNSEKVSGKIKSIIGKEKQWILLGGPPCQAYSLAGRSVLKYLKGDEEFEKDSRHKLYKEYLKIISRNSPSIFIMENVKGLISSKIKGKSTLTQIINDLKYPDKIFKNKEMKKYNLFSLDGTNDLFDNHDFLVDCSKYGVPQKRQRVIIIGIREDLGIKQLPKIKYEKDVSVADAISDLPKIRSIISNKIDSHNEWLTIFRSLEKSFKDSYFKNQIKKASKIKQFGSRYIKSKNICKLNSNWFHDPKLFGVVNHETRKHLWEDIQRYIYYSHYASKEKISPKLDFIPHNLRPNHKNIKKDKIIFNDRFRVQIKDEPAKTITSHISKDGHYFIHYDTSQARSLTVRESARIQTFPDNYFFEGNKTQQYIQVGNAVPPLMAHKIAEHIFVNVISKKI